MARLVLERHRPTLADLLARLPRWVTLALGLLAVLVVAGAVAARMAGAEDLDVYVHRSAPQFNFTYGDRLDPRPATEPGGLVALEERRGDLFVQSFAVRGVVLPAYRHDVGGILPLVADGEIEELERRFEGFELVTEGRARINEIPGYQVAFRARLGERRLVGRLILLPEPDPASRQAVALELLGTPVSGVSDARDVGSNAVLRPPLRSFRFGTERP